MNNYFKFTQKQIQILDKQESQREDLLSPFATRSKNAVRVVKSRSDRDHIRNPFSVDVDKILNHPFYNRYADKTQVFSFYQNDDITRRALHVQLVSKIARTIGKALCLNLDLIEAISLGHDIGHTPFGHRGEKYLDELYNKYSSKTGNAKRFSHNVHSVRILKEITNTNLTLQTLDGILSHNGEKAFQEYMPDKTSNFEEFENKFKKCYKDTKYINTLKPNTLEGCVVRISDMIAYIGKDRQDLFKAKLTMEQEFSQKGILGVKNAEIVSRLISNVIKCSIGKPYISMDDEVYKNLDVLRQENDQIYKHVDVVTTYENLIKPMMEKMYEKLLDDLGNRAFKSPIFKFYLNDAISGNCYRDKSTRKIICDPNDAVTDYIASMTDDYFIELFNYMKLDDELYKQIQYKPYFCN